MAREMLTLAICDDEAYFLERMESRVRQYLEGQGLEALIKVFTRGEELLDIGRDFDVVIADIKMPGKSGLEMAEQLRKTGRNSQIIFITSHQRYALQAFDLDAVHYLIKPVPDEKLFHALDKALKRVAENDGEALVISKGNGVWRVPIRDILYCEAIGHKILIHTATATYDYFGTLEALGGELDERFFRCHRSYIVNLNFVTGKERETAMVVGGDVVFVSRRKQQEFTQKLLTFFRKDVL